MKRLPMCVLLLLAPVAACASRAPGFELGRLASEWSGVEKPTCTEAAVDPFLPEYDRAAMECEWLHRGEVNTEERVWDMRDEAGRVRMVSWIRPVQDSAKAEQVVDSLARSLDAYGFRRRVCEGAPGAGPHWGRTIWEDGDLAVQLVVMARPDGSRGLLYTAVDDIRLLVEHLPCGASDARGSDATSMLPPRVR